MSAFEFEGTGWVVDPTYGTVEWDLETGEEPTEEQTKRAQHHWHFELEPQHETDDWDDGWYDVRDGR
jgi:hypothetical protein